MLLCVNFVIKIIMYSEVSKFWLTVILFNAVRLLGGDLIWMVTVFQLLLPVLDQWPSETALLLSPSYRSQKRMYMLFSPDQRASKGQARQLLSARAPWMEGVAFPWKKDDST